MCADENDFGSFAETLRSIAREVGRSVEQAVDQFDVDELAERFGVDPLQAREWAESAGGWFRSQAEAFGEDVAASAQAGAPHSTPDSADVEDPLRNAAPHPLDLPSEEQGRALAALESGRWAVEPGTDALTARGEGPGPSDALGLVRELRARDWIAASDGTVTAAGRHALGRWLDAAASAR
jgi:hypothetical protein